MWIDQQLPRDQDVFLDHVGYFVADVETAGSCLDRLGFQVSPINLQMNADDSGEMTPSDTSSRLARLRRGFIEMLAATQDTPFADQLRQALSRYEGIHLIALSHDDMPGQRDRLRAAGFKMQPIVNLRRPVRSPQSMREVGWSILRPEPGTMAEGRVQFVKCHTPDLSWPEGTTIHENRADALTDILVCVEDRHEAAARYARFADRDPTHMTHLSAVALERGRIVFAEPETAAGILPKLTLPSLPYMAGVAVHSSDLVATRETLMRRGIDPLYCDDQIICVGPADALGAYLVFHRGPAREPWSALAAHIASVRGPSI